ncbi:MAG: thioester reductase domain-containing protein [Methylococcaceae bacterium]|jgi:thioester reductase-like protein
MNTIIDYLEYWATVQPDKRLNSFVDIDGKDKVSYTYLDFCNHTRNLADYLSRCSGLKYGDRALLVYPAGLDMIAAFFACVRIGVIPIPVSPPTSMNFNASLEKLNFITNDCQAKFALTTQEFYRTYSSLISKYESTSRIKSENDLPQCDWVTTDNFKELAPEEFRNETNPILFLQYTSGSTSDPRGVMVSHENVIHNALSTIDHVPIGVTWLPQYHDMGLIGYYLFPVVTGGTTYGISPVDFLKRPILWLQTITRVKATYASSPNFGFEFCLREDKVPSEMLNELNLSSLRTLMNASEPVRTDTYQKFLEKFAPCGLMPEAHIVAYGLAENTLAAAHYGRRILTVNKRLLLQGKLQKENVQLHDDSQLSLASCGKPIDGVCLQIVDTQSCSRLDEEQIGEIWLSGKSVCHGYWERQEMTQEVFHNIVSNDPEDKNIYLRTGDLGFLQDGELFVCGRIKDLIIIKGVNYYPQDIEAIVESTSRNIRAGGVAAFDGGNEEGEALVVVVEVKNSQKLPDPAEIVHAVRTQYYIAPHTIIFVPPRTIAKTSSGKIARNLTRKDYLSGKLSTIATNIFVNQQKFEGELTNARQRFRYIFDEYNITGKEEYTFAELAIDSIILVQFLLDIQSLLKEKGAASFVDQVDIQFLQQLTIVEFFNLVDQLETAPQQAVDVWCYGLKQAQHEYENHVQDSMRSDAQLAENNCNIYSANREPLTDVLLTGATGFFGPFLLSSLLLQTTYMYHVLIRAKDPKHGMERIREALRRSLILTPSLAEELEKRVHVVCGDIAQRNLGMSPIDWESLTTQIQAVCHNAALVNYILNYETLKPHNVDGTRELLRFAFAGNPKEFHHISTTFIFGWTVKGTLPESDNNNEMMGLDFGYSQSKWVAEQLVFEAEKKGLKAHIYRPSLISASTLGVCDNNDIAIRLLAFMINHRVAVYTYNQISFLPADIVAHNIASIFKRRETDGCTLHVTADNYYNMMDVTRLITAKYGYPFTYYDIPGFIFEMNRRCTSADPLYPLLDFFNRSFSKIAAMQLKRYNNDQYRKAREQSGNGCPDPSLEDTVSYLVKHLLQAGLIPRIPKVVL